MKQSYLIPLSIGILASISGCQLQERGMALPPPKVKPRPQPKKTDYDFPLLKLKAFTTPNGKTKKQKNKKTIIDKSSSEPKVKSPMSSLVGIFEGIVESNSSSKTKNKPSVMPKKKTLSSKKLNNTKKKSIKNTIKKDATKPRRRKSGYANKLIFNKNTSLKEIPLPLPKVSSLKLNSLSKALPSIPASKIPILNNIIPEGSKTSNRRIKNNNKSDTSHSNSSQNNNTKQTSSKKLDMANIRIAKSNDYTTLIFDSYMWGGYNIASTEEASSSGTYKFNYEPENNRIVASIQGYSAFSALLGDQSKLFNESDVIENVYIDRYINEGSIEFIIELKKKVKITVLDVQDPGRIIVTLYPKQ